MSCDGAGKVYDRHYLKVASTPQFSHVPFFLRSGSDNVKQGGGVSEGLKLAYDPIPGARGERR